MTTTELTFNGRLPGLLCETSVPNRVEDPLRLDVVGFVGFAQRGPLDVPVLIEDFSQYQLIFGSDLPVAVYDGLPIYAYLPRAVEAFFENGGQRCYVVRVAGESNRSNRFFIPGLLTLGDDESSWQPMAVEAAWPGRWSDFVRIGTTINYLPLQVREDDAATLSGAELQSGEFSLLLQTPAIDTVRAGDLLQLHLQRADEATLPQDLRIYMRVGVVDVESTITLSLFGVPVTVEAASLQLFDHRPPQQNFQQIEQLTPQGWVTLPFGPSEINWLASTELDSAVPYRLLLPLEPTVKLNVGELLRLTSSDGTPILFMTVERLRRGTDPDDEGLARLVIESTQTLQPINLAGPELDGSESFVLTQVDHLSFDLIIQEGEETLERWTDLRFGPGIGYWADALAAPIDQTQTEPNAFRLTDFSGRSLRILLPSDLSAPSLDTEPEAGPEMAILPLGMGAIPQFFGPRPDGNPMGKDGLDTFEPVALFTDPDFVAVTTRNIVRQANELLYTGTETRRLRGLHSLFPVDEVALISLPDLAHRQWEALPEPPFMRPPEVSPESEEPTGFHDCPPELEVLPEEKERVPVLVLTPDETLTTSNFLAVLEDLPDGVAPELYNEEPLLTVQRMMIQMCAAQADRVAILNLPNHYRQRSVEQWQQKLVNTPAFFDGNPLSFAAVYHSWAGTREPTTPSLTPLRYQPPDGAVCGLIAAREIARGAWIAPANQPLRTVSDLSPDFDEHGWFSLYNHQVNVIRRQPGRFALMSAFTLARERTLCQLSVRRLLIFLRKLALREGARYVFETNNERFRASVQTYFERILSGLLESGGIQAFQVVTNEEVNTPLGLDNGRFVIALKVAPTSPIEFITVILLRSGDDGIDILEI